MHNTPAADPPSAPDATTAALVPSSALPTEVRVLDQFAWREYRDKPAMETANPVHTAMVADEAGNVRLCYVKLTPNMAEPTLLCEALGWVLAGHAGLRRADFAAIILVDKAKLAKSLTLNYLCTAFDGPFIPAWCTEAVPGKVIKSIANPTGKLNIQYVQDSKAFLNSVDAPKFAAFDMWTGLRDRNMGNVIRHSAGGYASIDHETVLHDTLWQDSIFNFNSLVADATAGLDPKRLKAFKSSMTLAAAGHPGALANAQVELQAILNYFLPSAKGTHADVFGALGTRSQNGWLAKELGVLDMAPKEDKI